MFKMNDVGRKIAARRKALNKTQMELADAMGVSFQAVSNWERGNSMPDIAKLPELAEWLDLSIDELLTNEEPAKLVRHILKGDEKTYIKEEAVQADTVAEIAPILKPQQTEDILEAVLENSQDGFDISDLISVAPFLSEEFLETWTMKAVRVDNVKQLAGLAPFLSESALDHLVDMLTQENIDIKSIIPLAPHLSEETLDYLAQRLSKEDLTARSIVPLAPFLSDSTLDALAKNIVANAAPDDLVPLAPFLSDETLKLCAESLLKVHGIKGIKNLAPFL